MPTVDLFKQDGTTNGTVTLNDDIFGIEPNKAVLFDAIVLQKNSRRQGTAKVKGRSEVRGGGRKPWRQKGTGRARAGSTRSPIWVGGGRVHGPHPRDFTNKTMPRKAARLAIKSALSDKANKENVLVVEELNFETPKTKEFVDFLNKLNVDAKVLVVAEDNGNNINLSSRNLKKVKVIKPEAINVLDIVHADQLIFTQTALTTVEEAFN